MPVLRTARGLLQRQEGIVQAAQLGAGGLPGFEGPAGQQGCQVRGPDGDLPAPLAPLGMEQARSNPTGGTAAKDYDMGRFGFAHSPVGIRRIANPPPGARRTV